MTSFRAASHTLWRVSVATYNRVIFLHPENETLMLALERRATASGDHARVRAQPFGGGVRILDPARLQEQIGEFEYDSDRSRTEQDFRILVPPGMWETVKQYCLYHLENPDDPELEALPDRELAEEFEEDLGVQLERHQYTIKPVGFAIEEDPAPTMNARAPGQLTVRLYRVFEVQLVDAALCAGLLAASQRYTDPELGSLALQDFQNGGRGRANAVLALPLAVVKESYLALPPQERFKSLEVDGHRLDKSVLAILHDVDVPQYRRL